MTLTREKSKSRKSVNTSFCGIPRLLLQHQSYQSLSGTAVKLLVDLAGQYKGCNNGDLTLAFGELSKRGWRSKQTITRAKRELEEAGLVVCTREGHFINPGARCALYALTWLPINECPGKGLELGPSTTPLLRLSFQNSGNPGPQRGQGSDQKRGRQRLKDERGRFVSVHKRERLRVVS